MTQHIKYPEEVRTEAIERLVKVAEANQELAEYCYDIVKSFEYLLPEEYRLNNVS